MSQNTFQNRVQTKARTVCRWLFLLQGTLLVLLCALQMPAAEAQITKKGDKYNFHVKFIKGQAFHYVITTTSRPLPGAKMAPGKGGPRVTTSPMSLTVKDVKGVVATLDVSLGPFMTDGKVVSKAQTAQMQVDDHNKALNRVKGSPVGAGLPPKPIRVGGTYSIDQKAVRDGAPLTIKATYLFRGIKTIGGQQVAEITARTTTRGKVLTQGTSTIYLSVADGSLVSTTTRQTATTLNAPKPISMTTDTVISRRR